MALPINDRDPTNLIELILKLQAQCGLSVPTTDEDWAICPRMCIDVRRSKLLADGLREAKKTRFDPTKLLKVVLYRA